MKRRISNKRFNETAVRAFVVQTNHFADDLKLHLS